MIAALEREGIPYALIGGMAVHAWGGRRPTYDADILAGAERERILAFAARNGYGILRNTEDMVFLKDPDTGMKTDILLSCKVPFYESLLERARPVPLRGPRTAALEDLVLLKALAWRKKDIEDIGELALEHAWRLDRGYLLAWAGILEEDTGLPLIERIRSLRPSEALKRNRETVLGILSGYGAKNPRVFGSVASGDDTLGSDVDFLVEMPSIDPTEAVRVKLGMEGTISKILGVYAQVLTIKDLPPEVREEALAEARSLDDPGWTPGQSHPKAPESRGERLDRRNMDSVRAMIRTLDKALGMLDGAPYEAFIDDELLKDAVTYLIGITGRKAARTTPEFRRRHSGIPWDELIDMADRNLREYDRIDYEGLWRMLREDFPRILSKLRAIRDSADG